jgi:tRNA (guanosine-2'-O-)-methyltransferase
MDLKEHLTRKALLEYLSGFITDDRRRVFDQVARQRTRHITVVLENLYQSHNASAVLRTCDCFGVQDVHVVEGGNRFDVNPDVALGSSKWLTIRKYKAARQGLEKVTSLLREQGYRIIATTPRRTGYLLDDMPITGRMALLFGTEMSGLSENAMACAGEFVSIPQYGFSESFNISVSAAIILHHLTEKLRKSEIPWRLSEAEIVDLKLDWARITLKKAGLLEKKFLNRGLAGEEDVCP